MLGYTRFAKSTSGLIDITMNNVTGSPATITASKGTVLQQRLMALLISSLQIQKK